MASVLKKKKSPTETMVENLPQPTVTPAKPSVQRIDLSQDQNAANYIQNAMGRGENLQRERDTPKVIKDRKTGMPIGVVTPDGVSHKGNGEEVQRIIQNYNNLNPGKGNPVPIYPGDKLRDTMNPRDFTPAQITPPPVEPVGNINEAPPDQLTKDIEANIIRRNAEENVGFNPEGQANYQAFQDLEPGYQLTPPPLLNKLGALFPNTGGVKATILNLAGENKELRAYLDDYSNYDNAEKIKAEVIVSDGEIQYAIKLAEAGKTKSADELFKSAIAKKKRSYSQFKLISQNDQRKYVDDLFKPMTELESYLYKGGQQVDEIAFLNAKTAGLNYG
jgi:hypothetical protein